MKCETDLTSLPNTPSAFIEEDDEELTAAHYARQRSRQLSTPTSKKSTPKKSPVAESESDESEKENEITGKSVFGFVKRNRKSKLMEIASLSAQNTPVKHPHSSKKATPLRNVWIPEEEEPASPSGRRASSAGLRTRNPAKSAPASRVPTRANSSAATPQRDEPKRLTRANSVVTPLKEEPKKLAKANSVVTPVKDESKRIKRASSVATPASDSKRITRANSVVTPVKEVEGRSTRSKRTSPVINCSPVRVVMKKIKIGLVDPHDLGTPTMNELKRSKRVESRLKSVINAESSESSSSSESESEKEDNPDHYFHSIKESSKTSDNTLSSLPQIDVATIKKALEKVKQKHVKECKMLLERHSLLFGQWKFELLQGFNLLLYGFGSKIEILSDFAKEHLTDAPLIIVNGFFPSITLKQIMAQFQKIVGFETSIVADQIQAIQEYQKPIHVLIHNIDGYNLRHEKVQTVLAQIAHLENIQMIASIDHINAPMMWDNVTKHQFNWISHDLTTFASYDREITFENTFLFSSLTGETSSLDVQGVLHVLRSLPANTKKIFREMAVWQLSEMKRLDRRSTRGTKGQDSKQIGLTFREFFRICNQKFLASTQQLFKTQLVEFKDHNLVKKVAGPDRGEDLLFIPLDKESLDAVLETMD